MLNVLYIEDNPANMRLVELILARRPNVKLLSATDPFSGLEIAKTEFIDLILLDINLPAMDGFEVLKNLRNMTAYSSAPVIAVSANAMPKDIEKAKNAGFDDYLTKPINVAELLDVIDKTSASLDAQPQ